MYLISEPKDYAIIILGAGGTGSWYANFLAKAGLGNDATIIDGDTVEMKNTLRQAFTMSEIHQPKANVVANRNNMAFINEFITNTQLLHDILNEIKEESPNKVPLIVGCLDNNASRKIAHDFFEEVSDCVWIDAGNAERHGQVYISIKENNQVIQPFDSPIRLNEQFQNYNGDERRPDQISCAEQSESAPQNVTANVTSACTLFNVTMILLNGGILTTNLIKFNTITLNVTPEAV